MKRPALHLTNLNGPWARLLGRSKTVQAMEEHAYEFGYDVARNDMREGWCPGCCNCSPATTVDPLCKGDGLLYCPPTEEASDVKGNGPFGF